MESYGWCSRSDMTEITCRSLKEPQKPDSKPKLYGAILGMGSGQEHRDKDEGLYAECSLDAGGAVCRADEQGLEVCPDIAYRVKCECEEATKLKV